MAENARATRPAKMKMTKLEKHNSLIAYSFLLPNFLGFFCFTMIPVVFSIGLAFMSWDGGVRNPMVFVGLDNFRTIFRNFSFTKSDMGISLYNTVVYTLFTVPLTIVIALGLAMILNKAVKGANFFRATFFFPYVASLVAVCTCWSFLLMRQGPVNQMLGAIGIHIDKSWTQAKGYSMWAIIIVSVWRNAGYYMVMYLAGLQGVPVELYEAATVDGANAWQKFRRITLPMLTPTTFFVSIMMVISCFKIFDVVNIMTAGGPGRATKMLVYYIYQLSFYDVPVKFGLASAVAMVLFAIVLLITVVQFQAEKKWVNYM